MNIVTCRIGMILLAVFAPLAEAAPCPVHGAEEAPQRVVYIYAQPGGMTTVAAAWSEDRPLESKAIEVSCKGASVDDRSRCIRCLAYAAVKAIRDGDPNDLALLSPPAMQKHVHALPWRDANGRMIPYPDEYVSMYPSIRYVNDRAIIGIIRKLRNGRVWPVTVLYAQRDSVTKQWVLTDEVSSSQFPLGPLNLAPQKHMPEGMTAFRIGKTKDAFDAPPIYPADTNRDHAAHRDALLYIRLDRLPYADAPILTVDRAQLDPAAAQLRDTLEAQTRWLHQEAFPYAELERQFTDISRHNLRQRVMPREFTKPPDERWTTGRGSFVTAPGIDTTLLLATMRVTARVQLEDGYVWYCWAPKGVDNGPEGAALVTLHQMRLPDGSWRMLVDSDDYYETEGQFDLDLQKRHYARELISRNINICRAVTEQDRTLFFKPRP